MQIDKESKQREVRAYKKVLGQQSESSSEISESDDGGKKRPKDENGERRKRRKKRGLGYALGLPTAILKIGGKNAEQTEQLLGQEAAAAQPQKQNEYDESTEDEFESKDYMKFKKNR